jgi:ribonuclease HII
MTALIRPSKPSGLGLNRELAARAEGYTCIAGLDEVGRGPDLPLVSILMQAYQ